MKHKTKNYFHALLSCLLAVVMIAGLFPAFTFTASAAQGNEYRDPAEHWLTTGNRTSELDVNANVTDTFMDCAVCGQLTLFRVYRVPEYTRSGGTALNRGVLFSDGTMIDGINRGNVDAGVPGVNATYTGYHWTKAVCTICGTLNGNGGEGYYGFGRDVYNLYDCAAGFMVDLSEKSIEQYNYRYHTEITKSGQYCQFCFGTHGTTTSKQVLHNLHEHIDPQIGNNRFTVSRDCDDCGYYENEVLTAKTVITSYYGEADGKAHTISLADLSDYGVNTSIRYGNTATNCNLTSAPNYVAPGYYNVYYAATYSYGGESMTENGVSYVQLYEDTSTGAGNNTPTQTTEAHTHDFRYLDTVQPTCVNLGYENWQCNGCGALEKRNYRNTTGHSYNSVVIREASCTQSGSTLYMCNRCGDFHTETTPMTAHSYTQKVISATCQSGGYTENKCGGCGHTYISNLTPNAAHHYHSEVTAPTCKERGYTTHICGVCGDNYVDTYTVESGHKWNGGEMLTSSTCEGEGVKVFTCTVCNEKMLQATNASGHRAGAAATCTQPQRCLDCYAILALPTGHEYREEIKPPTCSSLGYSVFSCIHGDDSYTGKFTDKLPHRYKSTVTPPTCEKMGYTEYVCLDCSDSYISNYTEILPHRYTTAVTAPKCVEMGYTVFNCLDCGEAHKGNYTDATGHDYFTSVTAPTCTDFGYTTNICKKCNDTFTSDITKMIPHNYFITITPPTCTALGYSTYKCLHCGDSKISDYTETVPHNYIEAITAPTCTELGYSIFTCKDCGDSYRGNEVNVKPHRYDPDVTAPTCVSMGHTTYTCLDCGEHFIGDYTDVLAHGYIEKITEPTCLTMGYTTYTCPDCGATHTDYYTEILPHNYQTDITEPTCLEMGFTVYTCADCNETHTQDYTDPLGHDYLEDVTAPTCTSMGFSVFTCSRCADTKTGNYTDALPHSYTGVTTEPDCVSMGYTVFTCDCGDTYTGAYTDATGHSYTETITAPTCTELGYSIFNCKDCGDSYRANEINALPHNYIGVTTAPTCEAMGFTVYTCDCGESYTGDYTDPTGHSYTAEVIQPDCLNLGYTVFTCDICADTYNGDFVAALGHAPSAWIVDAPATLEAAGSKHVECTVCGEILYTVILKQLNEVDYTDNNGRASVGGYIVIVTDKNAAPVPHAKVFIDVEDNIGVELPDGRLIDYNEQTTVTVLYAGDVEITEESENPEETENAGENEGEELRDNLSRSDGIAVPGLTVTVTDGNNNAAIDITDEAGKIIVPVSDTSTGGNGNGTIGGEDEDGNGKTYVVTVTDFYGVIVDDCKISIDEDGKINVDLLEGTPFDRDNPVTVTVTDNEGNPQAGLAVVVIGDNNATETGETNSAGRVTLPLTDRGYTNDEGKIKVNDFIVIVEDTQTPIAQAFVSHTEDGQITVLLPEPYILTTDNQITVTVLLAEGLTPVKDMRVTAFDYQNRNNTDLTNIHGKILVPPLDRGYTDGDGLVRVNGYIVKVEDTVSTITGAFVVNTTDNKITVLLPGTHSLNTDNQTTVTVLLAADETPVKNMSVTVSDTNDKTATKATDANGKIVVPDKTTTGGGGGGSTGGGGSSGGGGGYSGGGGGYVAPQPATVTHTAYVTGYPGGTFKPDGNMTRAEAAAIFARLLADKNGEKISGSATFPDVKYNEWYVDYIGYLKAYGIIVGYPDGTFKPDATITRAEFTVMAVRFYAAYNKTTASAGSKNNPFKDVQGSYWAISDIYTAVDKGWIIGYTDGTFKGESNISRAEVVTVVNRVLERKADTAYIDKNIATLTKFNDVSSRHWAYYEIMEAANTHKILKDKTAETWTK